MRKLICASLLALTLSGLTYAGNMPYPAPDPQPTPTTPSTTREATFGNIPNDRTGGGTAPPVMEVVLGLLRIVPALF